MKVYLFQIKIGSFCPLQQWKTEYIFIYIYLQITKKFLWKNLHSVIQNVILLRHFSTVTDISPGLQVNQLTVKALKINHIIWGVIWFNLALINGHFWWEQKYKKLALGRLCYMLLRVHLFMKS